MIANARLYKSQMQIACHYVEVVCNANANYLSGSERSLNAISVFDKERLQIETSVEWLIRNADDDEPGTYLIKLLRDGYQLLHARLDASELQRWLYRGLEVARRRNDQRSEAVQLIALGYALRTKETYQQSHPFFEQAYALAQSQADQRLLVHCLQALAKSYTERQDFDEAERCNQQAYELCRTLDYTVGMYQYFNLIGTRQYSEGKFAEALVTFEQAYRLALKAGAYREIAITRTLIGIIHHLQGHFQEAIAILRQGLEFSLRTQYPRVIIYTLHALGNSLAAALDTLGAQEAYIRALRIAEQYHLDENVGALRGELGLLAYQQNELRLAQNYLESALEQLRAIHSDYYYPAYLSYLVPIYLGLGDDTSAERALHEGVELAVQLSGEFERSLAIWGAVQVWMRRTTREPMPLTQQIELTETVVRWAGLVLASPHIEHNNRKVIQNLFPDMRACLGDERVEVLLQAGAQLDLASVIDQLHAASQ